MYIGAFTCKEDVLQEFSNSYDHVDEDLKEYNDINILLASYDCGNWEGDAFVLFERNGQLYEVNGSHCSCYGLEGQWNPEETSVEALRHRIEHGYVSSYHYDYRKELTEVLDKWEG
jgi:hypothetical protein